MNIVTLVSDSLNIFGQINGLNIQRLDCDCNLLFLYIEISGIAKAVMISSCIEFPFDDCYTGRVEFYLKVVILTF